MPVACNGIKTLNFSFKDHWMLNFKFPFSLTQALSPVGFKSQISLWLNKNLLAYSLPFISHLLIGLSYCHLIFSSLLITLFASIFVRVWKYTENQLQLNLRFRQCKLNTILLQRTIKLCYIRTNNLFTDK